MLDSRSYFDIFMMHISYQALGARAPAGSRDVREQRAITDRHHGLRQLQRQGAQPRSEAGSQDQRGRHRAEYARKLARFATRVVPERRR
jgi:hypothetical protein